MKLHVFDQWFLYLKVICHIIGEVSINIKQGTVSIVFQQVHHHVPVATSSCHVKRGPKVIILYIDVCIAFQQKLNSRNVVVQAALHVHVHVCVYVMCTI